MQVPAIGIIANRRGNRVGRCDESFTIVFVQLFFQRDDGDINALVFLSLIRNSNKDNATIVDDRTTTTFNVCARTVDQKVRVILLLSHLSSSLPLLSRYVHVWTRVYVCVVLTMRPSSSMFTINLVDDDDDDDDGVSSYLTFTCVQSTDGHLSSSSASSSSLDHPVVDANRTTEQMMCVCMSRC